MLIVYDSLTGNVKKFISKLNMKSIPIDDSLIVNESYILITYTVGFGEIPDSTVSFLGRNYEYIKAVAVSGNRNWGHTYGKAGKTISTRFNVPLLLTFELSGTQQDIDTFKEEVFKLVNSQVHRT